MSHASGVVLSGGVFSATWINDGSVLTVSPGATTTAVYASAGGTQIILGGGSAYGADICGASFEIVSSGGIGENALVESGGRTSALSGRCCSATR